MSKQLFAGLWPKEADDVEIIPAYDIGDGILGMDSKYNLFVTIEPDDKGEVRSLIDNQLLYLVGTSQAAIKLRKLELKVTA